MDTCKYVAYRYHRPERFFCSLKEANRVAFDTWLATGEATEARLVTSRQIYRNAIAADGTVLDWTDYFAYYYDNRFFRSDNFGATPLRLRCKFIPGPAAAAAEWVHIDPARGIAYKKRFADLDHDLIDIDIYGPTAVDAEAFFAEEAAEGGVFADWLEWAIDLDTGRVLFGPDVETKVLQLRLWEDIYWYWVPSEAMYVAKTIEDHVFAAFTAYGESLPIDKLIIDAGRLIAVDELAADGGPLSSHCVGELVRVYDIPAAIGDDVRAKIWRKYGYTEGGAA